MKKVLALLIPLLIVAIAAAAFIWIDSRPELPGGARARLNSQLGDRWVNQVREAPEPAARPWRFTEAQSSSAHGTSAHFLTEEATGPGLSALPYPPVELWCIRYGSIEPSRTLYLARHEDLYNADWILHEADDAVRQEVGCP